MHVRAILAIARKDAVEIPLHRSLLFNLALPLLLTVAYLFISALITQVSASPASLLVYNPDGSKLEQAMSGVFARSKVTLADSADQVQTTFGPDGSVRRTAYWLGLIIPANFESDLRAGRQPRVDLFVNHDEIGPVTTGLLQAAIGNYTRTAVDPRSPVVLATALINPGSSSSNDFSFGNYYAALSLLLSLMVGTSFVPVLLIEEREKKTLRMLMVMPASFQDVIAGKLLVTFLYQVCVLALVLAITAGFLGLSAQLPLIALYALLGAGFSMALGLLFAAVFQSSGTANTVSGLVATLYILAGVFVGPWKVWLAESPLLALARLFPTWYLADGAYDAWQNLGSLSGHALNLGVLLGSALVLFALAAWLLRRQAVHAASI